MSSIPGYITLLLSCLFIHHSAGQISTVQNQALYSGTPVLANPHGVPTLVYNCAKMPAICNNVHNNGGDFALSSAGPSGEKGPLTNVDYLTLHADTDTTRISSRRAQVCPTSWKSTHNCPEPDQPVVVPEPYNLGGRTVSTGFVGQVRDFANRDYNILDPGGDTTGMAFTCDEFPPAFSIEGGIQPGGSSSAKTYCAPQSRVDCDGRSTRSEQDFQSSAHGRVKDQEVAAGPLSLDEGIWEFRFMTVFVDDDDAYATRVDFYSAGDEFGSIYGVSEMAQKRSVGKVMHSEHHYGNGSVVRFTSPIIDKEDLDIISARNISSNFDIAFRPTATRHFSEPTMDFAALKKRQADACSLGDPPQLTDGPGELPGSASQETFATVSCFAAQVTTIVGFS